MKVLVVNAGSSSIKYQVMDMTNETVLAVGLVDRVGIPGSTLEHKPLGKDEEYILIYNYNITIMHILHN
jgi:acetate kinase